MNDDKPPEVPAGPKSPFSPMVGNWNIGRVRTLGAVPVQQSLPVDPLVAPAPVVPPKKTGARWATSAAQIVTGVAVVGIVDNARKPDAKSPGGYAVDTPDSDDIERCEAAVAEEFARRFGDADLPWWAGIGMAFGGLYLGVRQSRRKLPVADSGQTAVSGYVFTPGPSAPTAPVESVGPSLSIRRGGNDE